MDLLIILSFVFNIVFGVAIMILNNSVLNLKERIEIFEKVDWLFKRSSK